MARPLTWRSVRGGALLFLVLVGLSAAVLVYARVGALRGETFRLFVVTQEARGVIPGTEVWLAGQKVGRVSKVEFRDAATDTMTRLVIETEVREKFRDRIHLDSDVDIRAGGSIIGSIILNISVGTLRTREVVPGDTIRAARQADAERMASELGIAARQFPAIMSDVAEIRRLATQAGGRMGGSAQARETMRSASALMASVGGTRGTIGRLRNPNSELGARVRHAMAGADSVRQLLATRATELGRFRRDSTLLRSVGQLRDEIAAVRALASSSEGTVGRLRSDSAIFVGLDSVYAEMSALFADIRKRPLRYIAF